jgi:methylated-DNA-[protein]-cysteine S-methyltransferase
MKTEITPGSSRAATGLPPHRRGAPAATALAIIASPVGELRLIATDDGLAGILFPDHHGAAVSPVPTGVAPDHPVLRLAASQLAEYFAGTRDRFTIPLAPRGTPFQHRVWAALATIPYAETRSYLEIARAIGSPTAMRAVGAANGKNPLSIVVPCHRVIGADGTLTGFGGGLETKRWLLDHERRHGTRV